MCKEGKLVPCLYANRSHGQEDRERLPDAVVEAVLADSVDVDLINLAQKRCKDMLRPDVGT